MQHAEEPALARVVDDRVRGELPVGRHPDVPGLADLAVDVVGNGVVVQEPVYRRRVGQGAVRGDVGRARAKPGTPQQVLKQIGRAHV